MRVDIWSDYNCPWCGIGRRRFLKALERFEHRDQVEVVYHPYLLMPDIPVGTSEPTSEVLRRRKGMSEAQLAQISNVEKLGVEEGFSSYHLLDNQSGNATLAHEMTVFAQENGKGSEFIDATLNAYFEEKHDIFTVDGLVSLAERVGLNGNEAFEALNSRRYAQRVVNEMIQASQMGVNGVPFFLFGGKYAASGAQDPAVLLRGLQQAWDDRPRPIDIGASEGGSCDINGNCD